jgi:hypothetical protein
LIRGWRLIALFPACGGPRTQMQWVEMTVVAPGFAHLDRIEHQAAGFAPEAAREAGGDGGWALEKD